LLLVYFILPHRQGVLRNGTPILKEIHFLSLTLRVHERLFVVVINRFPIKPSALGSEAAGIIKIMAVYIANVFGALFIHFGRGLRVDCKLKVLGVLDVALIFLFSLFRYRWVDEGLNNCR